AALRWLRETFHLAVPPSVAESKRNLVGTDNVFGEIVAWAKAARRTWDSMSPVNKRFVAAVKDCLVAADVAGSALPKKLPDEPQRWMWISESFAEKPKQGELQEIVDHRLNGATPREFQVTVADSNTG